MRIGSKVHLVALSALASLSVGSTADAAVTSGTGVDVAAITPIRDQFRLELGGGTVAGANGLFGGVRREINWDGVPDNRSAPNDLPPDFFNTTSPRGAVFSTPGTAVQVSANAGAAPVRFDNIDPSYSSTFNAFSPQRLFTAVGSNIVDVNFFLPGTTTPGATRGFGAIFTDVDTAGTTSLEFFDLGHHSLGTFFVPALVGNGTFSFLGVSFNEAMLGSVRITNGNTALGAGVTDNNGSRDLVVMDDFLFGEVQPVPEPSSLVLMCLGGLLLTSGGYLRRRGSRAKAGPAPR